LLVKPIVLRMTYSCRTETPKFSHLEWPRLCDHATRGYPRHGNFGGQTDGQTTLLWQYSTSWSLVH